MPPLGRCLLALALLAPAALPAQTGAPPRPAPAGPGGPAAPGARAALPQGSGRLLGTAVAAAGGQPVSSAAVTVRAAGDSALVAGAVAQPDGTFRVDGLRPGRYTVRVRALGYAPVVRTVAVDAAAPRVDLGHIALSAIATQLAGVQVRNVLVPERGVSVIVFSNTAATAFGEVWQGRGLTHDLLRAALCP